MFNVSSFSVVVVCKLITDFISLMFGLQPVCWKRIRIKGFTVYAANHFSNQAKCISSMMKTIMKTYFRNCDGQIDLRLIKGAVCNIGLDSVGYHVL